MRKLISLTIGLIAAFTAFAQPTGKLLSKRIPIKFQMSHPRPIASEADTITLLFMGDVMLHQGQISNAYREDGTFSFETYFSNISSIIQDADLAVANMEFTLGGEPYTGYPAFSAPDNYAEYASDCGIDVFLTANNHILDRGKSGLQRTLSVYDTMESARHLKYTGTAIDSDSNLQRNPLIVPVKGRRIALVNFTYGTNNETPIAEPIVQRMDTTSISVCIRAAERKGADCIIALPHWGIEYELTHSVDQRRMAVWLARNGCDAVIGAHPHVAQDMDTVVVEGTSRLVPIVYSMGNVISNMSAPDTRIGMPVLLKIAFDGNGDCHVQAPEPIFTWCTRPGTLTQSYSTVPVRQFLGKRELWLSPSDYDDMVNEYEHVKKETKTID